MRQVAIINGTWKPSEPCKICGEVLFLLARVDLCAVLAAHGLPSVSFLQAHKMWECPVRSSSWKPAGIQCK
jgi:hypothetical protein